MDTSQGQSWGDWLQGIGTTLVNAKVGSMSPTTIPALGDNGYYYEGQASAPMGAPAPAPAPAAASAQTVPSWALLAIGLVAVVVLVR